MNDDTSLGDKAFPFIRVAPRPAKPRADGLTIVADRGMGPNRIGDLMETAADYIDVAKIAIGAFRLQSEAFLKTKIATYHDHGIKIFFAGDVTETGRIWHFGDKDFGRTMSTVAIADGLLYASDLSGFLYCLDVTNGKQHWKYDVLAAVWGSPYIVDGKVMLGDEDGELAVLEHSKTMKELAVNDMGNSLYTTPVAANGVLYITNRKTLFAIEKKQTQK